MKKLLPLSLLLIGVVFMSGCGIKTEEIENLYSYEPCNNNWTKEKYTAMPISLPIPKPFNSNVDDNRNWKIYSDFVDEYNDKEQKEWDRERKVESNNLDNCLTVNTSTDYGLLGCCYTGLGYFKWHKYSKNEESFREWLVGKLE